MEHIMAVALQPAGTTEGEDVDFAVDATFELQTISILKLDKTVKSIKGNSVQFCLTEAVS